jgi:catechol 2,3-dioxygenase-like lactoylglutathione lyase family enzyme
MNALPPAFRLENITPILYVQDMARSLAFYVDILGFTNAAWGDDQFTSINRDRTGLYLSRGAQGCAGTWVWMGFDGDMVSLQEYFIAKGVTIRLPPTNYSWAYELQIEDPDGHVLRFGTDPKEEEPYQDR